MKPKSRSFSINNYLIPTLNTIMRALGRQSRRMTDIQQNLFFILLGVSIFFPLFINPLVKFTDLYFVNFKAHFFYIAPALFIIGFSLYTVFYKATLSFNRIDFLLILYGVYSLVNYTLHGFGYNENLTTFILSIFTILLLKQIYSATHFGIYVKYGCFFVLIFFGLYEVIYGESQILGYRSSHHKLFSITGTFHNPGPYAIFLSPIFICSLAVILFPPTRPVLAKPLILLSWFSLIGISIILPATQSRSAWVGTIVGSLFVFYCKYKAELSLLYSKTKPAYRAGIGLLAFFAILVGSYLLYQYKPESADGRALVWRVGSGLFRENVFFGIGFEQFKANFGHLQSAFMEKHLNDPYLVERADYVPYAFNDFLQILIENGIVGLILFVAVLVLTVRIGLKQIATKSPFLIGSMGALLSLTIAGFFSYPFEVPVVWLSFLFFISIISHLSKGETITLFGNELVVKTLSVLAISVMILILKNEIHLIKAKTDWTKARNLLSGHFFEKSVEAYRATLRELPDKPEVMLGYGKALFMTGKFAQSAAILEKASTRIADPILYMNLGNAYLKLNKYEQSEKAYKKAISIIPNKLYPRYLLAKMYLSIGDSAEARKTAFYIVNMTVPVSSPASRQINDAMKKLLASR